MSDISFVHNFQLASIVMIRCSVERGAGSLDGPVRLETDARMREELDGSNLTYFVSLKYAAIAEDGEPQISGEVEFALNYELAKGYVPSENEIEHYAYGGVAFQAHPYLREHVMTMCSRSGLPPYTLPILARHPDTPQMEDLADLGALSE